MLGGIYSTEKCPMCGSAMKDNNRNAVTCPIHKHCKAASLIVRFGRRIWKRFEDYQEASRFLTGLRFKTDENTFDPRDYKRVNPLSLDILADKYLAMKKETVAPGTLKQIRAHMQRVRNFFGNISVKEIQYGGLEDFLFAQKDLSDKTKHNVMSTLHNFFQWLAKRKELSRDQMPEFPRISFELGWRKTVSKEIQNAILDEVRRLTAKNPRIYIAIQFLATYINVRPGELLQVLEEDVDYERGLIVIRNHKTVKHTRAPKIIPLLPEDLELLRSLPRGFPKMHLFRRDHGGGGRPAGSAFGKNILPSYWHMACKNLGINGIDMYAGTRHSSVQALRYSLSPEGIKRLTGHENNKAFNRYFEVQLDELREGFALTKRESKNRSLQHGRNTKKLKP